VSLQSPPISILSTTSTIREARSSQRRSNVQSRIDLDSLETCSVEPEIAQVQIVRNLHIRILIVLLSWTYLAKIASDLRASMSTTVLGHDQTFWHSMVVECAVSPPYW